MLIKMSNIIWSGPLDLMDCDDFEHGEPLPLPGVTKGDFSSRKARPQINVHSVQFCPTGRILSLVLYLLKY